MYLFLVGLNHETAPLQIRERVAFSGHRASVALEKLKAYRLPEVALLSTCNRTELYAILLKRDPSALVNFLHDVACEDLSNHLYVSQGADAARHLLRVASGLNSMILGEGQILSQVKTTHQQAAEAGTLGGLLSALFRQAITAGKRARTETAIARGAVSISNAATQLARDLFGDLADNTVMVLGAGETAELTLRLFADAGVHSIIVTNRTYQHAQNLAESLLGRAIRFDDLESEMVYADIIVSSTAAPHAILRQEMVARVMRKRRNRPLFLIDIAVPRDIEPSVGDLPNVFLYNIDDLRQVVDENLGQRRAEIVRVETIIEEELERFMSGWRGLSIGPLLKALQEKFEEIRLAELQKSGRKLAGLSVKEREAVERLTQGMMKRILKELIAQLRAQDDLSESVLYMETLRTLFQLPEELGGTVLPVPGELNELKVNSDHDDPSVKSSNGSPEADQVLEMRSASALNDTGCKR